MSTAPFQDGFPNQAQAAINASYFLSNEDRNEWFEWLKTADEQQQDELINILHTMWEDAQRQGNNQPVQTQDNLVQTEAQNQSDENSFIQPMANAMTNISEPEGVTSEADHSFSFDKKEIEPISQPKMNIENIESDQKYTPTSVISDVSDKIPEPEEVTFEFDTEEDIKAYTPKLVAEIKSENTLTEESVLNEKEEILNTKTTRRPAAGGIDFTSIRDNTKKIDIAAIKNTFIEARKIEEESLNGFVEKVSIVLGEFEEINDYIEAMTDKVLTINDEVINQAKDIQELKNQTQNRGGSLQDQVDEAKYDVEKILKELRNIRIEMKRSNDEIRSRLSVLEADSFRAENDGINQKLSVIKSELSKLQENNPNSTQTFSQQFQNRNAKLDTIKFDK